MRITKWLRRRKDEPEPVTIAAAAEYPAVRQSPVAGFSAADELADNHARFPFPRWALEGTAARRWILAGIPRGGVGAEIGVFRGHFSAVILETLAPRKFYMVDPWTTLGEFFPWANEYSNQGTLPTALARREAELRAAQFPGTESVVVEAVFPDCIAQLTEPLDWIYIDSSHNYKDTLRELDAAASILKPDGIIIGDDFYPDRSSYHHGVFRAVNEFVKKSRYEFVAAGPNAQWRLRRADPGAVARKGQKSINEEIADIEARYPPARGTIQEIETRRSVLAFAADRSCGAEVGAFRGQFSEVILDELTPRRLYLVEIWKEAGEGPSFTGRHPGDGELPAAVARRQAELRAGRFANTETVLVDGSLRDLLSGWDAGALDWVYLHAAVDFNEMISNLAAAADLVRPGGVIMGGGYLPDRRGFQHDVYRAVNDFVCTAPFDCVSLDHAGQWCLRRWISAGTAPPSD